MEQKHNKNSSFENVERNFSLPQETIKSQKYQKRHSFDKKSNSFYYDDLDIKASTRRAYDTYFRETQGIIRAYYWEKYAYERLIINKKKQLEDLRTELCQKKLKSANLQTHDNKFSYDRARFNKEADKGDIFSALPRLKDLSINTYDLPNKETDSDEKVPKKVAKSLETFGELKKELTSAITENKDIELKFLIEGEKVSEKQRASFKKSFELIGKQKLPNFKNIKDIMSYTQNQIRKKPEIVEARYEDFLLLKTQILPTLKYNYEQGITKLKFYLKEKFLPPKIRSKLWSYILPDPCRLNKTLFKGYTVPANRNIKLTLNLQLIESQLLKYCKSEKWIDTTESQISTCSFVILTFQNFRPDIQYRDGMQKLVVFFYTQSYSDFDTFKQISNQMLTSFFFKNYYKGRKHKLDMQRQVFSQVLLEYKKTDKNLQKVCPKNLPLLEKFFFQNASNMFLDIFDNKIVEKIVDYFVVYGDCVLYGVIIFILEEILNLLPNIKFEDAKIKDLMKIARVIDRAKVIQRILNLHNIKANYESIYKRLIEIN